jgi:hypothetical protein
MMTVNNALLINAGLASKWLETEDDAREWLSTLAASPLQYHLDDNVHDVFDCRQRVATHLTKMVARCFELLGEDAAWEHYYDECQAVN